MPVSLYCWRCEMDVPMLTESEWAQLEPALARAVSDVQAHRAEHGVGLKEGSVATWSWSQRARAVQRDHGIRGD